MPRPKPEFRWSGLAECRAGALDDLLALHWEEIEDHRDASPMDVDWPRYQALDKTGQLKILAVWAGRELVGYNAFLLHGPMHSRSTLWAANDVLYLDPEYRHGWVGVRLIRQAERDLKAMGAKVIWYTTKVADDLAGKRQRDIAGRLLRRLGYSSFDQSWSKAL